MIKAFIALGGLAFVLMFGAATIAVTATLYALCMELLCCWLTIRDAWRKLWNE